MHFMPQKEVVDRITAEPNSKEYGRLSVMIQHSAQRRFYLKYLRVLSIHHRSYG